MNYTRKKLYDLLILIHKEKEKSISMIKYQDAVNQI